MLPNPGALTESNVSRNVQSCSRVDWIENFIWIRAKGCFIGPVNDLQRIRMVLESLRARRRVAHQGTPRHTSSSFPAGAFLGLSSFDVLMGRAGRAGRAGLTCTIRRKTPNSILKRPRAASQPASRTKQTQTQFVWQPRSVAFSADAAGEHLHCSSSHSLRVRG